MMRALLKTALEFHRPRVLSGLVACALSGAASGYELLGPRWEETWSFQIDASCPDQIKEAVLERTGILEVFIPIRYLRETFSGARDLDSVNHFYCSSDFGQRLVTVPEGLNYTTFDLTGGTSNTVKGRAHMWWSGDEMMEVDVQIDPDLSGWMLTDVIDHEILHGAGCAHSEESAALMYPTIFFNKGHYYDDFRCLHSLYGLKHSIIDYRGNLFVPDARKLENGDSFWGVVRGGEVVVSGEN